MKIRVKLGMGSKNGISIQGLLQSVINLNMGESYATNFVGSKPQEDNTDSDLMSKLDVSSVDSTENGQSLA